MLVVGAKGLAKEVLESLYLNKDMKNLVFYDDINLDGPDFLFNEFPILKSPEAAREHFNKIDKRFILGVGFPEVRYKLFHKFLNLGGEPYSLLPNTSLFAHYDLEIAEGVTIGCNCALSSSVRVGKGSFINGFNIIGHDSKIGEFCEICPSVNIAGHCEVGDYTFIGTGVIIYPKVKIGKNVSITAGSVVRKNIPDNSIVHGNPSKIIGTKPAFDNSL